MSSTESPATAAGDLNTLLTRWREDLATWAIPDDIMASVTESPWELPSGVFARRADALTANPGGASYDRERAVLDPPGSVLDIGSGAGAASLPLLPHTTELIAVDASGRMLTLLAQRALARGVQARCVIGEWPHAAAEMPVVDLVTCHHVLYNVPDLEPFVTAMTAHARRAVVVEITADHPLTPLNDLWLRFHGLRRPERPTGADVLAILRALGLDARHRVWRRPGGPEYESFDELVQVTRRRLCLPSGRSQEVGSALVDAGVDPEHPADLGSSERDVLTIWWRGRAR